MNRTLFVFALIPFVVSFMVGCAQPIPEVKEELPKVELEKPAINPSAFPTPRPALEAAPDLSGAKLVVNDETLARMSADAVPAAVTDALKSLQGREFTNPAEFAEAVRGAVGTDADTYLERVMRNALVVSLADAPAAPEGEVSIAEREARVKEMAAAAAPQPTGGMGSPEFEVVYFDFDKSNIKPEFEGAISHNAQVLMSNSGMSVTIEGHCDERGTNEYNLALGERRAEAVRNALIAAGVSASQIQTVTYGEERPVALGHDEDSWSKNRRGVIVIN
jgi:peptidoglycan-associated lipoprotein